jgi:hypothetical protein
MEIVVHYGRQIAEMIYDHTIDIKIWISILNYLKNDRKMIPTTPMTSYKVYYLNDLQYEFNLTDEKKTYVCFHEIIHTINVTKMTNALTYSRQRIKQQEEFRPINQYYNIHELMRIVFNLSLHTMIIFESIDQQHEISIIHRGEAQELLNDPLVDQISKMIIF